MFHGGGRAGREARSPGDHAGALPDGAAGPRADAADGLPGPARARGSAPAFVLALVLAAFALTLGACGPGDAPAPLLVFAAASLEDALETLSETPGAMPFEAHLAGSNALASQVLAGAPADVILSASAEPVERLRAAGRVAEGSTREILETRLVVIVPAEAGEGPRQPADLLGLRRVVLADAELAPAGRHAEDWLASLGLLEDLRPRVVPMPDVRAALVAVAAGRADAGVVYETDARTSAAVRVAFVVEGPSAPRVIYVAAALRGPDEARARAFVEALAREDAFTAFAPLGYRRPDPRP